MKTHWCFTLNNPTNEETVIDLEVALETCRYAVFVLEVAPSTGTIHYQGYVELYRTQRRTYLERLLPRAHWEEREGSRTEARHYCLKPVEGCNCKHCPAAIGFKIAGPWEYGVFTGGGQGRRTDIIRIRDNVLNRVPIRSFIRQIRNNQQLRFAEGLLKYVQVDLTYSKKEVYWFWGPSGSGKTRAAIEGCDPEDVWINAGGTNSHWFDRYDFHRFVILDELRAKNYPYDTLLRLLDGYEMIVPFKGGFTTWDPAVVYITAPLPPERLYAGQLEFNGDIDQLLRRIIEIREFRDEPRIPEMFNQD